MQFATGLPFWVEAGSCDVNVEANSLSPDDPVSTQTWSMLWQLDVPGTHMLTVTYPWLVFPIGAPFTTGPASTTIAATLATLGGGAGLEDEELPPPQDDTATAADVRSASRKARESAVIGSAPRSRPPAFAAADKPSRRKRAGGPRCGSTGRTPRG